MRLPSGKGRGSAAGKIRATCSRSFASAVRAASFFGSIPSALSWCCFASPISPEGYAGRWRGRPRGERAERLSSSTSIASRSFFAAERSLPPPQPGLDRTWEAPKPAPDSSSRQENPPLAIPLDSVLALLSSDEGTPSACEVRFARLTPPMRALRRCARRSWLRSTACPWRCIPDRCDGARPEARTNHW